MISKTDCVRIDELAPILKIISQCDIKHIMALPIKTITSVFNVSTCIIISITAGPFGLDAILAIMSVSFFITAVILYLYHVKLYWIRQFNISHVVLSYFFFFYFWYRNVLVTEFHRQQQKENTRGLSFVNCQLYLDVPIYVNVYFCISYECAPVCM